jgi:hypothetical protein
MTARQRPKFRPGPRSAQPFPPHRDAPPGGRPAAHDQALIIEQGPGPRDLTGPCCVVAARAPRSWMLAQLRYQRLLGDKLGHRPEKFRVEVPAAYPVQPTRTPRQPVWRLTDQRVLTVFAAHRQGDHNDCAGDYSTEEESDDCDYETGHSGLQHFRPAKFLPRVLLPVAQASRGCLAGLAFVGHGVPVCPRSDPAVRYVQLSLTVQPSGFIWQVLAQPSRWTARIDPMRPAIQAIPTFGT